jgi:replicative DNA helicase
MAADGSKTARNGQKRTNWTRPTQKPDPDDPTPAPSVYDRTPPQNLECERGLLGCMLLDPFVCDDVFMILRAEDFYGAANETIFRAIREMHEHGKKIDGELLHSHLKRLHLIDSVGGLAYILELHDSVPHSGNARHYAAGIKDASLRRQLIHSSTECLSDAWDAPDVGEAIARYEGKLGEINAARNSDDLAFATDVALSVFHRQKNKKPRLPGIDFGMPQLNELLDSMRAGELVLLAARTSVGKSAKATSLVAYQLANTDNVGYFCSLEMSKEQLMERIIANLASIDTLRMRKHWLTEDELKRMQDAVLTIARGKRLFIDRAYYRTVQEVIAMARRTKRIAGRLDYMVIDYLQLLDPKPATKRASRNEQISEISRDLKNAAGDLGVPIIALCQLNREAEDGRPRLKHLRESGALEQNADKVIFIDRDTSEPEKNADGSQKDPEHGLTATIIVAKNRDGKLGDVKAAWFPGFQRYAEFYERF